MYLKNNSMIFKQIVTTENVDVPLYDLPISLEKIKTNKN